MATPRKKSESGKSARVEAGLVEEDFEPQVQDEALADGSWLDEEAEGFSESAPSATRISGMSEEEQNMEMTPVVVGPPAYGSPEPITSAGRLLPLSQHPFNAEALPEDHPAAIDEDYGKGYEGEIPPEQLGTSFPGAPQRTDLERDLLGLGEDGEEGEKDYASQTKADLLAEAQGRSLDVTASNNKDEIISALEDDDASA
jgi:hypothetical protein